MNFYQVLKKPVISEKSNDAREDQNKYSFYVHLDSTKLDIKKAVERVFEVKALKVTTSILRGKHKRKGTSFGMTKKRKKAIVTLAEGQKIKLFEEA